MTGDTFWGETSNAGHMGRRFEKASSVEASPSAISIGGFCPSAVAITSIGSLARLRLSHWFSRPPERHLDGHTLHSMPSKLGGYLQAVATNDNTKPPD